jgi:inosose dehydratase
VGTAIEHDDDVRMLVEATGVGICLDTGHMSIGGVDVLRFAREHAGRVSHVHLKDVDPGLAAQVREGTLEYGDDVAQGLYRPLGQGDVQVGAVVQALEQGGYRGWYVLEQDVQLAEVPPTAAGPVVDVHASVSFLRGLAESLA